MSVTIQVRGDTAANWTSVNPILAERELAVETDTNLFKIGDGVTAWNSLSYRALRQVDEAEILTFDTIAVPAAPAADKLNLFARPLAGRMMLRMQGPSGLSVPLQPSFFQNQVVMISTNTTTSVSVLGDTVTSVGTLSHPNADAVYGRMTNFRTGTSANNTAGTGNTNLGWVRTTDTLEAGGFFYYARLGLPGTNYNGTTGTTGSRIFVGLTSNTFAGMANTNTPTGHFCGFHRIHQGNDLQDTEWQFATRDNTTTTRTATGLTFAAERVYDFYIFCPPDGSFIGWRIDNIQDNTSFSGETTTTMPGLGTFMRAGFQLGSINGEARDIRMQRVYTESDR